MRGCTAGGGQYTSPHARVRRSVKAWRALGASRWVVRNILDGAQIPWKRRPRYYRARAFPVAEQDKEFALAEMERCVRLGYWTELFEEDKSKPVVIGNGFVTRSAGKQRFVIDASYQNEGIEDRSFKYESLADLTPQLRPDDHLLGWDIKDAYHHVRLREVDKPYFAFQCMGRVFQCNTMPFGLKVAPFLWTKVCRPVVQALRREGFRVVVYVDDFGGAPPTRARRKGATKQDAVDAGHRVRRLFADLGLTLHPTKGVWHGTQCLPLLGFLVDTKRRLFLLQPARTAKIIGMAGRLLASAKTHRRWVRYSALRSFCGTAVSTQLAVTAARLHLRSPYSAMRDHLDKSSGRVRLGRQGMQDLQWWRALAAHAEMGRALWPREADVVLTTDASGTGWGATWDGLGPARGFHSPSRKKAHINLLELGAVRLGLLPFVDFLRQPETIIRLRTDSLVTMHVINTGSSRSDALMRELRRLHRVCLALGVTIRAEYIPSALNLWADRLSRTADSTDWSLRRSTFLEYERMYGPHTVDLFATAEDKQCGRFFSRFPSPGGGGVDAMRQNWRLENGWANPPFNLVGPVVTKIVEQGAAVTLVAPHWPSQPWWPLAVAACMALHLLPAADGVFTHGTREGPARRPWWRVVVFRFAGRREIPCYA